MASEVGICNSALQKIGASRITTLTEDSKNGRACNVAYPICKDRELRTHPWNFAVTRTQLAADATAPIFGRARAFPLPSDFIRLMPKYPEDNVINDLDWQIEGLKIYTDDDAPLDIRYLFRVTDPNTFDILFQEALATRIALQIVEEITQSNTKKELLNQDYISVIKEARRVNAIERVALVGPEDTWITARENGSGINFTFS